MITAKIQDHGGKELTGSEMYAMVDDFWKDIGSHAAEPFASWYNLVKMIPYVSDGTLFPKSIVELVPRPAYLLNRNYFPRLDCKKKSILIGAWAKANGYPFRFLGVSGTPDKNVAHVFPQIDFGNGWVTVDATLPEYRIGQGFPITYAVELQR